MPSTDGKWTVIVRVHLPETDFLLEAVYSVIMQSYENKHVIVVAHMRDKDWIRRIEKAIEPLKDLIDITVMVADRDKSEIRSYPYNVALNQCQSDYVSFLDRDDVYYFDFSEKLLPQLRKDGVNLVYGNMIYAQQEEIGKDLYKTVDKKKGYGEPFNPVKLVSGNYIPTGSFVYDFAVFKDARFDETLDCWEDWDFMLQLLFSGRLKAKYIDADVAEYRVRGEGFSNVIDSYESKLDAYFKYIEDKYAGKQFGVMYEDAFRVYPTPPVLSRKPNDSDIQKLNEKVKELDDIKRRKLYRALTTSSSFRSLGNKVKRKIHS